MNEIDGQILQVVISHAMLLYIKREKREKRERKKLKSRENVSIEWLFWVGKKETKWECTWLRNERVSFVVIALPASGRMNPHSDGVHQHSQRIRR